MLSRLVEGACCILTAWLVSIVARVNRRAGLFATAKKARVALAIVQASTSRDASRVLVTVSVEVFTVVFRRARTNLNALTSVAFIASAHVRTSPRHVASSKGITATVCLLAVVDSLAFQLAISGVPLPAFALVLPWASVLAHSIHVAAVQRGVVARVDSHAAFTGTRVAIVACARLLDREFLTLNWITGSASCLHVAHSALFNAVVDWAASLAVSHIMGVALAAADTGPSAFACGHFIAATVGIAVSFDRLSANVNCCARLAITLVTNIAMAEVGVWARGLACRVDIATATVDGTALNCFTSDTVASEGGIASACARANALWGACGILRAGAMVRCAAVDLCTREAVASIPLVAGARPVARRRLEAERVHSAIAVVDVALENLVANLAVALVTSLAFAVACAGSRVFAFGVLRAAVRALCANIDGSTHGAVAREAEVASALVRAGTCHVTVRVRAAQTVLDGAAVQRIAKHTIASVASLTCACKRAGSHARSDWDLCANTVVFVAPAVVHVTAGRNVVHGRQGIHL